MTFPKLHSVSPFPAAAQRSPWRDLAAEPRLKGFWNEITDMAEKAMTSPVPHLSPIRYMDFGRNGNRGVFEADYFARRRNLEALVLAETLNYTGRYIERIIEYLDAILSEYTWCAPAHTRQAPDPMPFFKSECIDLFSAETSDYLAHTLVLLEDELKAVSPNFVARIRHEVLKRAILPIEEGIERFHWHKGTHNWTVWIASNLLWTANTILKDDPERFTRFAEILEDSLSEYVIYYAEDGGCDEGCGYWNLSPTRYFLFVECLIQASDGAYQPPRPDKLKKMCQFISDCWMGSKYFTMFADNGGRHAIQYGLIRAMANRTGCEKTMDFINRFEQNAPLATMPHTGLVCTLFSLFTPVEQVPPVKDFLSVYPVLQQTYARCGRCYAAIKGGTNGEAHNHLDIGEFVLAKDGVPVILDPGSMQYTKDSFSPNRYSIWTMNSTAHNPLMFNGIGQKTGREAFARDFVCDGTPEHFTVSMDLSQCYGEETGLIAYTRTMMLNDGILTVHDQWQTRQPAVATMNLYHLQETLPMTADVPASTQALDISDPWLADKWGRRLFRTTLSAPPVTTGSITLVLKP